MKISASIAYAAESILHSTSKGSQTSQLCQRQIFSLGYKLNENPPFSPTFTTEVSEYLSLQYIEESQKFQVVPR